jgi:D-beta-D-heptose 7-phosphate kinase/D-beta-D-heptose 1-phosphate adenosyltransferase
MDRKQRSTVRPGGAANTAANLAALGATPHLIGLVGIDRESVELQGALLECGAPVDFLISETARPTTTKTRVIASHQQIVGVDEEDIAPIPREALAAAQGGPGRCLTVRRPAKLPAV